MKSPIPSGSNLISLVAHIPGEPDVSWILDRSMNMVTLRIVLDLINARKNRVLLLAQAALPEHQFKAFRTLLLDEFGQKGLESELARVFAEDRQHGADRNGQE